MTLLFPESQISRTWIEILNLDDDWLSASKLGCAYVNRQRKIGLKLNSFHFYLSQRKFFDILCQIRVTCIDFPVNCSSFISASDAYHHCCRLFRRFIHETYHNVFMYRGQVDNGADKGIEFAHTKYTMTEKRTFHAIHLKGVLSSN